MKSLVKNIEQKHLVTLFLIVLGTLLIFRPPEDPDFGWHYKYGEYIFTHGKILRDNIFSHTLTEYRWANSYWLSQLFFFVTHRFMGSMAAAFLASVLFCSIVVSIIKKTTDNVLIQLASTVLLYTVINWYSIPIRPLGFSTVFLFFLIYTLTHNNAKVKYLPLLFLLWANMHADFILGLFIFGMYTGERVINLLKQPICFTEKLKNIACESLPLLAGTLATLVNPYTTELWITLLKELTQPAKAFVGEWTPHTPDTFQQYAALSTVFAVSILASLSLRKKTGNWFPATVMFFFFFSAKSSYMSRIFILLSIFGLINTLEIMFSMFSPILNRSKIREKIAMRVAGWVFIVILSSTAFSSSVPHLLRSQSIEKWSTYSKYPYGCVDYLKSHPMEGNMLNNYNWGGYLIWQLPEYKTFIDGRMTAWRSNGKYFMEDYLKMEYYPNSNTELIRRYFKEYDISWILHRPGSKLTQHLVSQTDAKWEETYSDETCVIMTKNID